MTWRSRRARFAIASAPALTGCISQGRTRPEVLANVREAIEICVESGATSADAEVEVAVVEVDAA